MTDDLVKRLRVQADTSLMRLPEDHVYVSHGDAADRIEELEKRIKLLENEIENLEYEICEMENYS